MSQPARDPDALLRRLEWTVIRRLDGMLQGNYRTLFRGHGLDLADLREYQFHDDVRHIDWNVTARLQTPHVREFIEDREVTAWFLLDVSPSVDFGVNAKKLEIATELVAVLARLLSRHGNRVGAIFYSGTLDATIPPRQGRNHVLYILRTLMSRPEPSRSRVTDLTEFLTAGYRAISRRSLVFVVSDFISEPGWERPLQWLARRHELLAVRLVDPLEQALPDLGLVVMQDAETGEQMVVDTHDRKFRERFAEAARRREAELREALRQAAADTLELSTDDDVLDAILRYADMRRHRRQLASRGTLPAHLSGSR